MEGSLISGALPCKGVVIRRSNFRGSEMEGVLNEKEKEKESESRRERRIENGS